MRFSKAQCTAVQFHPVHTKELQYSLHLVLSADYATIVVVLHSPSSFEFAIAMLAVILQNIFSVRSKTAIIKTAKCKVQSAKL